MKRTDTAGRRRAEAGFSLIELMIALGVTLVVSGLAMTLLVASFNIRAREDRKSDAISDLRRTLATMSREIGNAGYGAPGASSNGIVAADSGNNSIRILTNSDRFRTDLSCVSADSPSCPDEDVIYRFINDTVNNQRYLVRFDVNSSAIARESVVANRIDSFIIRYFPQKVTYQVANCDITNPVDDAGNAVTELTQAQYPQATFVVMSACVQLPAVGQPGSPGYQPGPIWQQLTSDVQLRNAALLTY